MLLNEIVLKEMKLCVCIIMCPPLWKMTSQMLIRKQNSQLSGMFCVTLDLSLTLTSATVIMSLTHLLLHELSTTI